MAETTPSSTLEHQTKENRQKNSLFYKEELFLQKHLFNENSPVLSKLESLKKKQHTKKPLLALCQILTQQYDYTHARTTPPLSAQHTARDQSPQTIRVGEQPLTRGLKKHGEP